MYETLLNFLIKNNFHSLNKILFNVFKFSLKKRIVLNFLKYKFYAYPQKKELSRWMIKNLKIWDEYSVEIILKQIKNDNSIFEDLFDKVKHLPKGHEVVGNYILSKNINLN